MNSSFLYLLGDCITTSVYERNTKVTQSSYISKINKLRNAVPNAVMPIWRRMAFALAISLPIGGKKVILRMKVAATSISVRIVTMIAGNGYPLPRAVTATLVALKSRMNLFSLCGEASEGAALRPKF